MKAEYFLYFLIFCYLIQSWYIGKIVRLNKSMLDTLRRQQGLIDKGLSFNEQAYKDNKDVLQNSRDTLNLARVLRKENENLKKELH